MHCGFLNLIFDQKPTLRSERQAADGARTSRYAMRCREAYALRNSSAHLCMIQAMKSITPNASRGACLAADAGAIRDAIKRRISDDLARRRLFDVASSSVSSRRACAGPRLTANQRRTQILPVNYHKKKPELTIVAQRCRHATDDVLSCRWYVAHRYRYSRLRNCRKSMITKIIRMSNHERIEVGADDLT